MIIPNVIYRIKQRFLCGSHPSLNDLDQKLSKYLNKKSGFFIEVGANDGYCQSNTYYLEKKLDWTGLLVEGIPDLYRICKKTRKRSMVFHCALVAEAHKEPTVEMHYANLMSMVDGSLNGNNCHNEHLEKGREIQSLGRTYSVQVPARTLTSILDELDNLQQIDFFSLDVEGYELNVLKGLDLERYRPVYILVEANDYGSVDKYLTSHNYEQVEKLTDHDYLYISR